MESLFQGSRRARQPGRLKATVWAGPPDTGRPETTQGGSGGAPESGPASAAGYRPRPSTGNTWTCSPTSKNIQQQEYHKLGDLQIRAGLRHHRGAVGGPQTLAQPVQRGTGPTLHRQHLDMLSHIKEHSTASNRRNIY